MTKRPWLSDNCVLVFVGVECALGRGSSIGNRCKHKRFECAGANESRRKLEQYLVQYWWWSSDNYETHRGTGIMRSICENWKSAHKETWFTQFAICSSRRRHLCTSIQFCVGGKLARSLEIPPSNTHTHIIYIVLVYYIYKYAIILNASRIVGSTAFQ